MTTPSQITHREVWLRRSASPNPCAPGRWHSFSLSELGNAAARETLVTETLPFAAIWTDLFRSMIVQDHTLRWCENGPGVGRDARIAYSSLLGRYTARAYLTENEGVRVLVPLDKAKRILHETPYRIEKDPPGRGLEADWIGLDDHRLVIAEAKGSFDEGIRTWCGPYSIPQVLQTAIAQAQRTAVFNVSTKLPSKRWAVASRWATEHNGRTPTILAWDPEGEKLEKDDYRALAKILHRADLEGVMRGLGHAGAVEMLSAPSRPPSGELRLDIGGQHLEPGFAAIIGPTVMQPLRDRGDLDRARRICELNLNVAVVSLSSRYIAAIRGAFWSDEEGAPHAQLLEALDDEGHLARRAGLTVVWPEGDEDIALLDD